MFEALLRYHREKRRVRNSMRELYRNGLCSVQIYGNVTLAQKLHTRFFGH
jgi:hypothetical protein